MNNLIMTALTISGVFIICFPVVMYLLDRIMTKIENEADQKKSLLYPELDTQKYQ